MRFQVQKGARYAIGLELPFLLTKSTITEWARANGFAQIAVRDRPDRWPYQTRPTAYSDSWDTLVEATYAGSSDHVDAPAAPAWFLRVDFAAAHEKKKNRPRRRKAKARKAATPRPERPSSQPRRPRIISTP